MIPRPPVSTRTYTLFPHTTLFRSNPPLPATTPREKPPMPRRLLPLALALASASAFAQAPAPAAAPSPPLTLAQVMADPDWIGNAVEDFWWAWDSRAAQFERKREGATIRDSWRSEEHTSELQSLMRISSAVFCLKKKTQVILGAHNSVDQFIQTVKIVTN